MEKTRLVVLILASVLAACAAGNVSTATYATMSEARAAGAVERGWLPAQLPAEAYELRAAYDVKGGRQWGLFNFRSADEQGLREVLSADEIPVAGMELDVPGRIEWWPVQLRGRLDEERIRATGLRAYRSTDRALVFLVNWSQGRGYYWKSVNAE